jgi:hypothetical protein
MRSPFAILREIRRNSRRVERNRFDRAQSAGFVLFAFIAPLVVWKMESLRVREITSTLMVLRAFEMLDDAGRAIGVRATEIDPKDRGAPWPQSLPLADIDFVQRTVWRGWPLVTSHTEFAAESKVTRLPACPAARVPEVLRAARIVIDRKGVAVDADTTRTHIAAWVFSSGAWWIMLSMALAIVLAPIRLAWFLRKETRTAVRQSRIGRCHCPSCGYNAKHSILHGRCPECGSELYERPTY